MKNMSVTQICQHIRALPMKQKIWATILVVVVVFSILPRGGGITLDDAKKRIELANKAAQGKLCLMKIDAATCAYVLDDAWFKVPYEVCYTHRSEVDVVVDLTDVTVSKIAGGFKVTVPEPIIDEGTLNIVADNLKLWKHFGEDFRSERAKTMCGKIAEDEICKDLRQTVYDKKVFSMFEAKCQAESVLQSIYSGLGVGKVVVAFKKVTDEFKED